GAVRSVFLHPRDVGVHAAVRRSAAGLNLAHDAACDVIAREQFRRTPRGLVALRVAPALLGIVGRRALVVVRDVVEHEPAAVLVLQDATFAAHAFGDEDAAHT